MIKFCPNVTTLGQARDLGVDYLLVPQGEPAPPGSVKRATIPVANPQPGDIFAKPPRAEDVYEVPNSGVATLSIGTGAERVPVRISGSNPSRLTIVTVAHHEVAAAAEVTPLCRAGERPSTGNPFPLRRSSIFGLEVRIPAGTHRIELDILATALLGGGHRRRLHSTRLGGTADLVLATGPAAEGQLSSRFLLQLKTTRSSGPVQGLSDRPPRAGIHFPSCASWPIGLQPFAPSFGVSRRIVGLQSHSTVTTRLLGIGLRRVRLPLC